MGFQPATPPVLHDLLQKTCSQGMCSAVQYLAIAREIHRRSPCRVLVFGGGNDSILWSELNRGGRTLFVEDDPKWIRKLSDQGCEHLPVHYPSARGRWAGECTMPSELAGPWDVVFIDGPRGNSSGTPGRELPVRWAWQISGGPSIFVHDWDRPWEQEVCNRYLGAPRTVLPGHEKPRDLAVWGCNGWG